MSFIKSFLAKTPMTSIVRYYVLPNLADTPGILSLSDLTKRISKVAGSEIVVDDNLQTPEFAYSLAYLAKKFGLSKSILLFFYHSSLKCSHLDSASSEFISMYSKISQCIM